MYESEGWFITPPIISSALIDEGLYGIERHYAGERDFYLPISSGYLDWRPEHGAGLRLNDYVSLLNAQLRDLVFNSPIGKIAAALMGVSSVRLFHDQLICKPPGGDHGIGWHVDATYWKSCTQRDQMLTAWIPFQDCTLENGSLAVMSKSHEWEDTNWMNTFGESDLNKLTEKLIAAGQSPDIRPLMMNLGQVSFHNAWTIHGSYPNKSSQKRLALAVHIQADGNTYNQAYRNDKDWRIHINDLMCSKTPAGFPDYSDDSIFPILYGGKSET